MKIKNIVWDWNGTIVDDSWLFVEIMNIFLKKHGLPQTSIQDYRKSFVFPIKKYWASLGFILNSNEFENINSKFINLYKTQMFRASLHSKITCVLNSLKQEGFVQILLSASEKSLLQRGLSFYKLDGFNVVGLFPAQRVSPRQEQQLTCWGNNVTSLAVK